MDRTEKREDVTRASSCPECGHLENPSENRYCGCCGATVERSLARSGELTLRAKESGVRPRERFLLNGLGPVGKTVAVGLAIVAVDLGLAWLHRRLEKTDRPAPVVPQDVSRAWREERPRGGPGYLQGYVLKEAGLLVREGRESRGWFSSELTIRSRRVEK